MEPRCWTPSLFSSGCAFRAAPHRPIRAATRSRAQIPPSTLMRALCPRLPWWRSLDMETKRLRAIQHPQRTTVLLESWVSSQNFLPVQAYRLRTLEELSAPLRELARRCNGGDSVWSAWTDGLRIWFVAAVPSLEHARECGKPVLQIRLYDERASMLSAEHCVHTMSHGWQRCS